MKKEHIALVVVGVLVGVAGFLAFSGGIFGGHEYSCADGTAFRLSVSRDNKSVSVHPSVNASVFPVRTLERVTGEVGSTFVGGNVVLFGKGTDLQLITSSSSTVCTSKSGKEAINWGE